MNLENRIKQYLDNSIEFVEWQKDGLTLNDVAWLMEDFINNDRLVCKNNKPFAIPAVSVSLPKEKPLGECVRDGCFKPQRNCGLCEEHYAEFAGNLKRQ